MTNFCLNSSLSEISMATQACYSIPFAWNIFFHPFILSLCLSLSLRYVSYTQQIVLSCFFLIQSASFIWRIKTIIIHSYLLMKVHSNTCHFVGFVMFDSFLILICLSTHLVEFILSYILMVFFIFPSVYRIPLLSSALLSANEFFYLSQKVFFPHSIIMDSFLNTII
jgi:hypothetical protein